MTTLTLEGLTCDHCVFAVKQALEDIPGVESADVKLDRAVVQGNAPVAQLIAAVEEEGYRAREAS